MEWELVAAHSGIIAIVFCLWFVGEIPTTPAGLVMGLSLFSALRIHWLLKHRKE